MIERENAEPVSWLRLEQYRLGELSAEQRGEVERALLADAATRECFEIAQQPIELRPWVGSPVLLNPRPEVPGVRALPRLLPALRASRWPALGALAAAAAVLLYVATRPTEIDENWPAAHVRVKGGEIAIELIRDRQGAIAIAPESYAAGDRFKVRLTCPPASPSRYTVMVLQDDQVFFPVPPAEAVACANNVPLPGAFSLSGGTPASVCVSWDARAAEINPVPREHIARALKSAVCATLRSE
jgi:hypothetical protein